MEHAFIVVKEKIICCLIYHQAVQKRCIKSPFGRPSLHLPFQIQELTPSKTDIRKNNSRISLKALQSHFIKLTKKANAVTENLFCVCHLNHKQPLQWRGVFKICNDYHHLDTIHRQSRRPKNKQWNVLLGRTLVMRRVEWLSEDISDQLLKGFECFFINVNHQV